MDIEVTEGIMRKSLRSKKMKDVIFFCAFMYLDDGRCVDFSTIREKIIALGYKDGKDAYIEKTKKQIIEWSNGWLKNEGLTERRA